MGTQVMTAQSADQIRQNALSTLLSGSELINKSYLAELGNLPLERVETQLSRAMDVRIFHVSRIVLENKQSVLESATAAYTALGTAGYSVFFLLKSDGIETKLYIGTRGESHKALGKNAGDLLEQVMNGHFSGSELTNQNHEKVNELLDGIETNAQSITAVTGVPSLSLDDKNHFMQGLEHFIDAAEGKKYQALILAEPVSPKQLEVIRTGYERVSTQLSPLLKQTLSFGQNESESVSLALSQGLSQSLGESLGLTETKADTIGSSYTSGTSDTLTDSKSSTTGTSDSHAKSFSSSYSKTEGTSSSTGKSKLATLGGAIAGGALGFLAGGPMGAAVGAGVGAGIGGAVMGEQKSSSSTHSTTEGTTDTHTKSFSQTSGYSRAKGINESQSFSGSYSQSNALSATQSYTDTVSINQSETESRTLGSSRQITLEGTDKHIEQLLQRIDHQLARVEEARQYGAWNTAAYFISDGQASSEALASIFLGLIRGVNSSSEDFSLTTWAGAGLYSRGQREKVLGWLKELSHPRLLDQRYSALNIPYLTPTTLVSTKEMAIQLGLPRRSTSAVTVIEAQSFGRKVQRANDVNEEKDRQVNLGNVYHLWNEMKHSPINLNIDHLTSHVFVTGSTGSGKSNTVYTLLNQLKNEHHIPFMVIEPAKGEYKHIFGMQDDVMVLGTNPKLNALLRINPFKFPDDIHVLEHIDRLVEIFNVCWPMYAAMPAVLKEAMLQAYQVCGWDLDQSINEFSPALYPSFTDLLGALEQVINQSAFSDEVKSNYVGSLVTRVKSLTNGLNGQIFTTQEIDNHDLFDRNVIVDLSRVGSQETKSLIMGILVIRLNEHRMAYSGMNQPLKHITVLEEAHNILKRTSTEQSSEGANVSGKAVEMLSNAIAEMRTYGEGFIIADQSPSAVDISAIRNTNTKIIMRLPDEDDRRLAGKAAAVTEDQLEEIAKLPKGVAVVYQNDWLEPVLCKIQHFVHNEERYHYTPEKTSQNRLAFDLAVINFLLQKRMPNPEMIELDLITEGLNQYELSATVKVPLLRALDQYHKTGNIDLWQQHHFISLAKLITDFVGLKKDVAEIVFNEAIAQSEDLSSFSFQLERLIGSQFTGISEATNLALQEALLRDFSLGNETHLAFYKQWRQFIRG